MLNAFILNIQKNQICQFDKRQIEILTEVNIVVIDSVVKVACPLSENAITIMYVSGIARQNLTEIEEYI